MISAVIGSTYGFDEEINFLWDSSNWIQTTDARLWTARNFYSHLLPDEISIHAEDECLIFKLYKDGWCYGKNVSTGAVGYFPQGNPFKVFLMHLDCFDSLDLLSCDRQPGGSSSPSFVSHASSRFKDRLRLRIPQSGLSRRTQIIIIFMCIGAIALILSLGLLLSP